MNFSIIKAQKWDCLKKKRKKEKKKKKAHASLDFLKNCDEKQIFILERPNTAEEER